MNRKRLAFTLIELLVVIAIIAMLLAIISPSLRIALDRAEEIIDEVNMRSLGQGVAAYCSNNDNLFPSPGDWIFKNFNRGDPKNRFPDDGGPMNYNCVWHNGTLQPDGLVTEYLEKKVLLSNSFKKMAPRRARCLTDPDSVKHNGMEIAPQFNYSMNAFLGDIIPWTTDPAFKDQTHNLKKLSQAKSPSTLLVFGEENPFLIPAGKRPTLTMGTKTVYNDCILYVISPVGAKAKIDGLPSGKYAPPSAYGLVDALATFHKAKDTEKFLGSSKASFADGHTETVIPEDSLKHAWPY